MPRSTSRRRKPTGIVVAVLVAVIVVALAALFGLDRGTEGEETVTRSAVSTTARIPATTTTTGQAVAYQVQPGDTLSSIADRFGVTTEAIVAANQIADRDHLTEGQSLVIPPAPPVGLEIKPVEVTAGETIELTLNGAKPTERVTFQVDSPIGSFTGPAHGVSADGTVTATYDLLRTDIAGTYNVIAKGNQGTTAQSSFRVKAARS
jgi:LysM repeat protein